MDEADLLEKLIALLNSHEIQYCVIGGQAVNAYAEPLVSLDLDLVVAVEQLELVETLLAKHFTVRRFPHSLIISLSDSALRVQIQTDPRYATFPAHAAERLVLGLALPVAQVEDLLQGKIWAASDPQRRTSKRQKDLADISRLLENYPHLRPQVPEKILSKLL